MIVSFYRGGNQCGIKNVWGGGMVMYVSSILKIEGIASFIANMNKDATHHVGYCGDEKACLQHYIIE